MLLSKAWFAFSSLFFPNRIMEIPSPLPLMFSTRRNSTEVFLSILWHQVKKTDDPTKSIKDHPITKIGFRKKGSSSEHEFLDITAVALNEDKKDGNVQLILERTASEVDILDDSTINRFLDHRFSKVLLDVILDTIRSTSAATSDAVAAPIQGVASSIIAAPSTHVLMKNASFLPSPALTPKDDLHDEASMTLAEILQIVNDSHTGRLVTRSLDKSMPTSDTRAEDAFVGGPLVNDVQYTSAAHLGEFKPKNLTLFHLALLSYVVHTEYPLYSLFMNQCYWFASTVFYAAQVIDNELSATQHPSSSLAADFDPDVNVGCDNKDFDNIYLPFIKLHIPEDAGCWKGIHISGCKKVVLFSIVAKFNEQLNEYMVKVILIFIFFKSFY